MSGDATHWFSELTGRHRRVTVFFLVILAALLFLFPTLFRQAAPENWISKPLSLGLDLSGGVHLVYEVEAKEAVKSRLQGIANAARGDLRKEKIPVTRAVVDDSNHIVISLLSSRHSQRAKESIGNDYKEVSFIEERTTEGDRVDLIFGVSEARAEQIEREAVDQAIETLRNRVDQFGVAEPLIQKVGNKRILLQMPGVSDIAAVKKVVGSVAKLEFRMVPSAGATSGVVTFKDRENQPVRLEDVPVMTGDAVEGARPSTDTTGIGVTLNLTGDGKRAFCRLTRENVGREMAIILDGVVYSAPRINEPICGGSAWISGSFTFEEARQLAVVLRAGALPAPLNVMEERTVGPTLGQESIEKGIKAIAIGFLFIALFMVLYYKKSGVVAVVSLLVNIVLILAALSAFGATLTLPGLVGLALTVGMAVDANVIIFERIRDEIRNGSGRDAAVAAGFQKAFSAIIDANLTTLLTGFILYFFGTGPIRGFAVTLSIGVFTTLYCGIFVGRIAFDYFPLRGRKTLSI